MVPQARQEGEDAAHNDENAFIFANHSPTARSVPTTFVRALLVVPDLGEER